MKEQEHANDMGACVVLDRAIPRPGARCRMAGSRGGLAADAHLQSTPLGIRTVKEPLVAGRRLHLPVQGQGAQERCKAFCSSLDLWL